jgi:hypothetical protein
MINAAAAVLKEPLRDTMQLIRSASPPQSPTPFSASIVKAKLRNKAKKSQPAIEKAATHRSLQSQRHARDDDPPRFLNAISGVRFISECGA